MGWWCWSYLAFSSHMASSKRTGVRTPLQDITNTTSDGLNITTVGGSIQSCVQPPIVARRIYNAMIADGVAPDVSTYNTLIWGFGLWKNMEGHGVTPDVTTYNALLNAWAGDLESAHKVFDEMTGEGIERNSVSYTMS